MDNDIRKKSSKEEILEVNNLSKSFGGIEAVSNLNLRVEKGDIFGFLGPNGAGKTTTIRMILGLIHADRGEVNIKGYNLKKDFNKAIENVGAVVETPRFYEYLSAYQNLKQIANFHPEINNNWIAVTLKIVGLTGRANDKVKTYSLGMKQRLGIARALLNKPTLIILDEPTNGLDPQGMKEVRELIVRLAEKNGITFFISTHLLNEVEQICNRVAIIKKGGVIVSDLVSNLLIQNQEVIEIVSTDISRVKDIIEDVSFTELVGESQKGVFVKLDKGLAGQLNKLLIKENVLVEYLIPRKKSLEDYFIEITEEGDKVV